VPQPYDLIGVDAYRQPYIPYHLTTYEFFHEVQAHLSENGVATINVGHILGDYRLVDAIAATMRAVFPSVYVIDLPGVRVVNTIVVATMQPSTMADFLANVAALEHPTLRIVVDHILARCNPRAWVGEGMIFTDDRAPIEQVVDQMILNYVQGRP
jgi:spermidine synthase